MAVEVWCDHFLPARGWLMQRRTGKRRDWRMFDCRGLSRHRVSGLGSPRPEGIAIGRRGGLTQISILKSQMESRICFLDYCC